MPHEKRSVASIGTVVSTFSGSMLGLHPVSVFTDRHDNVVTVTLKGLLPEIERLGAKERRIADLITRNYKAAYKAVCGILESKIAAILGKKVDASNFLLDPESNCGTIILHIEEP